MKTTKSKQSKFKAVMALSILSTVAVPVSSVEAQEAPSINADMLNNPTISVGRGFYSFIKPDGTVWSAGKDWYGYLGHGKIIDSEAPVQAIGLENVKVIKAGHYHTLALKEDGTVWSFGRNTSGELGDGTKINRSTPVQVIGLTDIIDIDAGSDFSVALKADGTVFSWGNESQGRLGGIYSSDQTIPVQVKGLENVKSIKAGSDHTVTLKEDGTVWSFGVNASGELGNGSLEYQSVTPVQAKGLTNVISIAPGPSHTLALTSDGTIYSWGYNSYAQLGLGYTSSWTYKINTPREVTAIKDVVQINSGAFALTSDGKVYRWGLLGITKVTEIPNLDNVTSLIDEGYVQKNDGTIWARNANDYIQVFGAGDIKQPSSSGAKSNPEIQKAQESLAKLSEELKELQNTPDEALTQGMIDEMTELYNAVAEQVKALPEGEVKTALQAELQSLKDILLEAQAKFNTEEATSFVENVASLSDEELTTELVDSSVALVAKATDSLSYLSEGTTLESLKEKINESNELIGETQARLDVTTAEKTLGTEYATKAEASISSIEDSEVKSSLVERLTLVNELIDVNENLNAVLSSTPSTFVALNKNIIVTEESKSVLTSVGDNVQKDSMIAHVNRLEGISLQAEDKNIQDLLSLLEDKSLKKEILSFESMELLVKYAIEQTGAETKRDFGKVQSFVQKLAKNHVQGNEVKAIVMNYLQ